MKIFDKYYNKEYTLKAIYVIGTVLITFTLGLLIYYLSGKIGGAVSFVSGVLTPLILGLVITYLLSPVVKKLEEGPLSSLKKQSSRRVAAVILTFIIVLLALGLILGAVAFTVSRSLSSFSFSEVKEYITILSVQFSNFWDTIEQQLASMNINLGSLGDMLGRIFNSVKNGATTLLFAIIFAIYFLLDHKIVTYWGDVLKTLTNEKTRAKLRAFAADADRVFSGYIRGQSIDALIVGVLSAIALFIGGIPYAVVIGILTGVGNLVPYVGPVVGFGSLIIVCLAEGSIMHLLIGGIILAAVMFIDGNIINPRMLSSNVEVHPVLVIIALIAGGKFGGVVGMLVAVPVAALLKLQFDKYIEKRKKKNKAIQEAKAAEEYKETKESGMTEESLEVEESQITNEEAVQ